MARVSLGLIEGDWELIAMSESRGKTSRAPVLDGGFNPNIEEVIRSRIQRGALDKKIALRDVSKIEIDLAEYYGQPDPVMGGHPIIINGPFVNEKKRLRIVIPSGFMNTGIIKVLDAERRKENDLGIPFIEFVDVS